MRVTAPVGPRFAMTASVLLAACAIGAASAEVLAQNPAPDQQKHVYVSYYGAHVQKPVVAAYPLVGPKPAARPDRVYVGVSAPIAIGPDGRLYTTSGSFSNTIAVFAAGSTKLERTITIPSSVCSYYPRPSAVAVDANNYLYVAYNSVCSILVSVKSALPGSGVLVYPPSASGSSAPAAVIDIGNFPDETCCAAGLAIDRTGDLNLAVNGSLAYVSTYATPETKPTLVRTLLSQEVLGDLAVDRSNGELYAVSCPSVPNCFITVFPARASGFAIPARQIFPVRESQKLIRFSGVALDGHEIFTAASTYTGGKLLEFDAPHAGPQVPLSVIKIPNGLGVAIGP